MEQSNDFRSIDFEYGGGTGISALMTFERDFQRGELDPVTEKNLETASFLSKYYKARADSFMTLYHRGILKTLEKFDDFALIGELLGSEGKNLPEEFNNGEKTLKKLIDTSSNGITTPDAIKTISSLHEKALEILTQKQIEITS